MNVSNSRIMFVLIHGMWETSACWAFLKKWLEHYGFFCVAPDLKYHNGDITKTDKNLGTTGILDYVKDLEEEIQSLSEKHSRHEIVLIGHSMGGLLAQILLSRNPKDYLAGIFLTPAPPAGIWTMQQKVLECFSEHFKWGFWNKSFILSEEKLVYAMYQNIDKTRCEEIIKNLQEESGRAAAEIGFWQIDLLLNLLKGKSLCASTSVNFNLGHPMLFVGAEQDNIIPPDVVKKTARRYNASYQEISNAPHYILENKRTLEIILNFIARDMHAKTNKEAFLLPRLSLASAY